MKDDNKYKDVEATSGFREAEDGPGSVLSSPVDVNDNVPAETTSISTKKKVKIERDEVKPKIIPPPGTGQKIYEIDPYLQGYREHLDFRWVDFLP